MAKKMNFRNDMQEAKAPEVHAEEVERLPTEKGYTRTKRKLKGTKNNEQTLRHGKKPIEKPKQSGKLKSAVISQQLHQRLEQADEDNNIGVEAVNRGTQTAEAGAAVARDTVGKVRKYGKKLHERSVKPEVGAEKETLRHVEEETAEGVKTAATAKTVKAGDVTGKAVSGVEKSNAFSRFMQRRIIKQEYAAAKTGRNVGHAASHGVAVKPALKERVSKVFGRAGEFVKGHAGGIAIGAAFLFLLVFLFTQMSSCSSMIGGSGGTLLGSSYTAEDDDIRGANSDYTALEDALRRQIDNIESTHSGYDEYRYNLDEINHNPYVLTSYLTVMYEDYTRAEVQDALQELFDKQYELELEEEVETRYRTETRTRTVEHSSVDPETGEEDGERIMEDQKRYTGEKKMEEITLHFGKGTAEPFTSKDGKEMMRIVIPNQDRSDHTPWASFVLPAKAVHENQYGKGLWAKVPADGTTTVTKPHLAGQRDGKNIWEDERKAVPNKELKGMVEFYKAAGRDSRPRGSGPEL